MTVKFAYPPPLDKIRSAHAHSQKIKGEVSVQNLTGSGAENEVRDRDRGSGRRPVEREPPGHAGRSERHLRRKAGAGKLDFNNAGQQALAERLRDALARNSVAMTEPQLQDLARRPARSPRHGSIPG